MDWVGEFARRFGRDTRLQRLKEEHFHGHLELHFFNGIVGGVDKEESIRPEEKPAGAKSN